LSPALIILRSDDAARVAELHANAAQDAWPVQDYRNLLKQTTSLAIGAIDEGTGTLSSFLVCQIAGDTADILMVATHPDFRRKGLARKLMHSLLKRAGERGIARLTLDVAADNRAAIALYESLEFVTDGQRLRYYRRGDDRIDAALMSRRVTRLP